MTQLRMTLQNLHDSFKQGHCPCLKLPRQRLAQGILPIEQFLSGGSGCRASSVALIQQDALASACAI